MNMFQKATRKKAKLKLAISGPSGSGKSYGALRLACGMSSKVAVLDTENGSASLYSDRFNFDVLDVPPPYDQSKFIDGVKAAVAGGYEVVVIDSASHFWEGILAYKDALDKRGGNSFTNWNEAGNKFKSILDAILQSPIHVICCLRSKQDYVLETNERGKQTPRKVGMAPIMRDGVEYEFTTVFDVDMAHQTKTSKDRTGLFTDSIFQITEDTGKQLLAWLDKGEGAPIPAPSQATIERRAADASVALGVPVTAPKPGEWLKDQKDEVSRIKSDLADLSPLALDEFTKLWPTVKSLAPSDAIDQLSTLLRKWQELCNQDK